MTSQPNLFAKSYDVCESRHGGAEASVAANPTDNDKTYWQSRIFDLIKFAGPWGLTAYDLSYALADGTRQFKPKNEISGRLSELHYRTKEVFTSGQRSGCAVYVSNKFQAEGGR